MKLFNNHSGLRGLPCLAEGIYWATGLSLATPFTEGRPGVNDKASPPGRHQEQAPKQRCTFSSTTFSSVQFKSSRGPIQSVARGNLSGFSISLDVFDVPRRLCGLVGKVVKWDSATSSILFCIEGVTMSLGIWWVRAAERGNVHTLPVTNVHPVAVQTTSLDHV